MVQIGSVLECFYVFYDSLDLKKKQKTHFFLFSPYVFCCLEETLKNFHNLKTALYSLFPDEKMLFHSQNQSSPYLTVKKANSRKVCTVAINYEANIQDAKLIREKLSQAPTVYFTVPARTSPSLAYIGEGAQVRTPSPALPRGTKIMQNQGKTMLF